MKKILSNLALLFFLFGWTLFAIASGKSQVLTCNHEWTAGFNHIENLSGNVENEAESIEGNTSIDSYLPGGLHTFILH